MSQLQLNGAAVSSQMSVHVPAPAGEDCEAHALDAALRARGRLQATVPRSGVPGSVIETATVLKSAAAAKVLPGDCELPVKSAPELLTPLRAIAASPSQSSAMRLTPRPPSRAAGLEAELPPQRARLKAAIKRRQAIASMRTFLMPSAESA